MYRGGLQLAHGRLIGIFEFFGLLGELGQQLCHLLATLNGLVGLSAQIAPYHPLATVQPVVAVPSVCGIAERTQLSDFLEDNSCHAAAHVLVVGQT